MGLSRSQESALSKLLAVGNSELGVPLDGPICNYLLAVIARDLGLSTEFPELPDNVEGFFTRGLLQSLRVEGPDFRPLFERLLTLRADGDTYFYCLAKLHKARLKYERILQAQPLPNIDQVGPRGLLQFGSLPPDSLAAFLFWRKWIFDIDNRAGQETGYVFEPILAYSIGGVPAGSKGSPIMRGGTGSAKRQVDCVRESDRRAYEFKIRVTIAASGQGRWSEELEFPIDCSKSGYTPVLIVLDPTPNPKLEELERAFAAAGGESHVGEAAWAHLETQAGSTMASFVKNYVHYPIQELLRQVPTELPDIHFSVRGDRLSIRIGNDDEMLDELSVKRNTGSAMPVEGPDPIPEDVDDELNSL